jgi:hypothetical protein
LYLSQGAQFVPEWTQTSYLCGGAQFLPQSCICLEESSLYQNGHRLHIYLEEPSFCHRVVFVSRSPVGADPKHSVAVAQELRRRATDSDLSALGAGRVFSSAFVLVFSFTSRFCIWTLLHLASLFYFSFLSNVFSRAKCFSTSFFFFCRSASRLFAGNIFFYLSWFNRTWS